MSKDIRVTEIFYSLQGEAKTVGVPTVFVRLTGCPLRCTYCDTAYAFSGGKLMDVASILDEVASYSPRYVTVTGGEPLAQPPCYDLLSALCDQGYVVSLETSGALDVSQVDSRVVKVIDIKTPGSGEHERNLYQNLEYLSNDDQIKVVIQNRDDYEWAKDLLEEKALHERCEILFSPSHGELDNAKLADWIINDNLPVRFQIQLHKYIWGDVPGR